MAGCGGTTEGACGVVTQEGTAASGFRFSSTVSAYLGLHHPQAFDEIANGFIPLSDVPNARHQCNRVLIASDFVQSLIGFSMKLDCKEAEDIHHDAGSRRTRAPTDVKE